MKRSAFAVFAALLLAGAVPSVEERLEQHRNLGKAFYENPTTASEAVAEFKKALDLTPDSNRERLNYALALLHAGKGDQAVALLKDVQKRDPKLPHTWFNLGIWYRKAGNPEEAIRQFEGMLRLTPEEPIAHYQLGALLKQQGKNTEAATQFEQATKLNPLLAGPHFQLYNLCRQMGRGADASQQLQTFQALKKQQEGAATAEDMDWCSYAEVYDPPRAPSTELSSMEPALPLIDKKIDGNVDRKTAGLVAIDATGKGQVDVLVWSLRGAALYRNGTDLATDSGLADLRNVINIAPGDFDNDGLMDLCVLTETGPHLYRNTGGHFVPFAADLPKRRFDRAVWLDYDHDYDLDLVLLGETSALLRNQGQAGFIDRTGDFPFVNGRVTDAYKLRVVPDSKAFDLAVFYSGHLPVIYRDQLGGHYINAAFNGQPRDHSQIAFGVDRVRIDDNGIRFLRFPTFTHWMRIQLAGVKSLKTGQDAEIEIKAGSLYRKQMYEGVPLFFDLLDHTEADVVRITWMNGLIQNEANQPTNKAYRYEEANRLSGSCPLIWTWDGGAFRFITDVLGVAPLGASDGEGSYFPVAHTEYVSIPGTALKAVNGHYEVRITEELSEVSYLDQVQLYALDHPANTEIFTNDKFKSPPFPEFRLYGVDRRIKPARLEQQPFRRTATGIAEMHSLDLDFTGRSKTSAATLFLRGWVDWADGSTFRAASQESKDGLVFPKLQMRDASGAWRTVNADMGMPSGKPKTIAVPLTWISAYRELRITTNLCVYWDDAFLGENPNPIATQTAAPLESADLHYGGFSDPAAPFWNPTPGMYTRYGDVRELARDVDDRLIVMGSGDQLSLRFSAAAFPPLKPGWTRDYLLKVEGWAKDRDPNTAFSTTVEPLPFHAMSAYPYPPNEHFPDEKYRREYNTRPALRLIRPLTD